MNNAIVRNDKYDPRTAEGLLSKLEALIERAKLGVITASPRSWFFQERSLAQKERGRRYSKSNYAKNREAVIASVKRYRRAVNPETKKTYAEKYRLKNRENIEWKLNRNLSKRLSSILRSQGIKPPRMLLLLGCSIASFKLYLESKFGIGMTWENYGSAWEMDHVIPCAIFDFSKPEHVKRCFHFSNLQPLSVRENRRKANNAWPVKIEDVFP